MEIKDPKEYFNSTYMEWKKTFQKKNTIIRKMIHRLGISKGHSVLDVASGVGVLYEALKKVELSNYVALDISEKMLEEVRNAYPEARTICEDFDQEIQLEGVFDFIILFNSIPHFEHLNTVFSNVKRHLKPGGTFAIVHGRTRQGLKEHHQRIGYNLGREAIPTVETLQALVRQYEFREVDIQEEDFFYFSCKR